MELITGKNYIGYQLSSDGSKRLKTFNPQLNAENPWEFSEATDHEIEQAAALAEQAFHAYKHVSGKEKARFLNAIADEILALGSSIIEVYCLESGLPSGRAENERNRTIAQLRFFAEMVLEGNWVQASIDTAIPDRKPFPKEDIRKMLIPIGPVVVFGASNFPLAFSTAGGDTASALAAGCSVIVKSHPMHMGTSELVASAIIKAARKTNMPNGIFSNLNGGASLGSELVKHPLIKAVGFTGSLRAGRALMDLAAQRPCPIPVFAEMGSINPVVILPKALENESEKWASSFATSITLGTGQFCTNPGLILAVKGDDLTRFENQLSQELKKTGSSCMLHPSIKANFTKTKETLQKQADVKVILENATEHPNHSSATLLSVSAHAFLANKTLHQEAFGPLSIIVHCDDEQQLLNIVQQLDGQLSATIISETDELSQYPHLVDALQNKVGRMVFNGVPTGTEVCPSMMHGGPYPASSDPRYTAIGLHAVQRWVRPVCYQNWPDNLLPPALQNANPLHIMRTVNNQQTASALSICHEKHSFA